MRPVDLSNRIIMNRIMKRLFLISLLTLSALVSCRLHDGPPKTDHLGQEPKPHDGVFVSGGDTLFFNGDGKTVRWSFAKPAKTLNTQGEGSYVFKLYHGKYRYDASEEFSIYDGEKSHTFMTGPGMNTESQISFYVFDDDGDKDNDLRVFKKVKN